MTSPFSRVIGLSLLLTATGLLAVPSTTKATPLIVNLEANDIVYSSTSNLLYAAVPDGAPTNPNSLTPINVSTGALQSSIAIGFNPQEVSISFDGNVIHSSFGGGVGIQPYTIPTQSFGTQAFLPDGTHRITEMHAIPGRPNAVVVVQRGTTGSPYSRPTLVFENSVQLPNSVGSPDTVSVDPTDGASGYGYNSSLSSYDDFNLTFDANGVSNAASTLNLTGTGYGRLTRLGNRLFTRNGNVYNINPAFQTATFSPSETYLVDPDKNRLYAIAPNNSSSKTLNVYQLDTVQLLGSETISGTSGTAQDLIRYGEGGLAFHTTGDQIVLFESQLVPEPETWAMMGLAFGFFLLLAYRQRTKRIAVSSLQA